MRRSYRIRFTPALGFLLLFATSGCKKDPVPAAAPATPPAGPAAPEGPPGAPPGTFVKETPPTPLPAAPDAAVPPPSAAIDAGAAPVVPEQADTAAAPTAPAAPNELSDVPKKRVERPARQLCARACNKTQQCGVGGASVADCFGGCANAIRDEALPEARAAAAGYRAQDACADGPCTSFVACSEVDAPRQAAYLDHPPLSPKAALAHCEVLCEREKTCEPEHFKARASGIAGCLVDCNMTLTDTDLRFAEGRAQLEAAYVCRDETCEGLRVCVEKLSAAAAPKEPGHDGHDH